MKFIVMAMAKLQSARVVFMVSSPPKIRGGILVFKIWTKRGVMKKLLKNRGLVERGEFS